MTHTPHPAPSTGPGRALRAAGLVALVAAVAACASVKRAVESYSVAPSGLALPEDRLRRTLALGRYDSAMVRAARKDHGAPGDALLRGLYAGLVAYYAGDVERSTGAFDRVYALTDDRLTRSVSRQAASLVTNDRALAWTPSPTERLLGRHYAMLAFVRKGDRAAAAVEARRLVLMLQELDDAGTPVERGTRALLHYVAGAVFDAAGDRNDADVAWRNAATLGLDAPERRDGDDSATVLVLVEHGWIAHKVERSLTIGFGTRDEIASYADDEGRRAHQAVLRREAGGKAKEKSQRERADSLLRDAWEDLDEPRQAPTRDEGSTAAAPGKRGAPEMRGGNMGGTRAPDRAPERVVRPSPQPAPRPTRAPADATQARRERTGTITVGSNVSSIERLFGLMVEQEQDDWYVDAWDRPMLLRTTTSPGYVLTLAWPSLARPEPAPGPMAVKVFTGDSLIASDMPVHAASLSDAVALDFRRQRSAIFARSVARAATKYWLSEQAEKKKKWAGVLVNAAGDLLERADTRSWHLLPGEVSLVRLRVPAGTHALTVDVASPGRGAPTFLELGTVTVAAGETRVVSGRIWGARLPRAPLPVAPRAAQ